MTQIQQVTLDGTVLKQDSDIEKVINNKVTSSFSIHMVHVKECPEAVSSWLAKNKG